MPARKREGADGREPSESERTCDYDLNLLQSMWYFRTL